MFMRVPRGARLAVGPVTGDLVVEPGAVVRPEAGTIVSATGSIELRGNASIEGSLEAAQIRAGRGRVSVDGDVRVRGAARFEHADVRVGGDLEAIEVDVGPSLEVGGSVSGRRVDVGGVLRTRKDLRADRLAVGGQVVVGGLTSAQRVDVGGIAEFAEVALGHLDVGTSVSLRSGTVRGRAGIGGRLAASGALAFEALDVGGSVTLGPKSRGGEIRAGGAVRATGDVTLGSVRSGGPVSVDGAVRGGSFLLGGPFTAREADLSGPLVVGGVCDVQGRVHADFLKPMGGIRANRVEVETKAELYRRAEIQTSLQALSVHLAPWTTATGWIVAREVRLGRGAQAEKVFGDLVDLGRQSLVGEVVGDRVSLGRGAHVARLRYVRGLEVGDDAVVDASPERLASLPTPPR